MDEFTFKRIIALSSGERLDYNASQTWMDLFLEGKLETDEQKALREENEKLRAKQDEMLASLGKKQLEVDLLKKKLHLD